ncbi:cysteine desulfurase family protein [Novosphingobium album (ex Liu et al. 2023)]|uniref:Cysteine desulfurase n=1 Tax=Novosphingobium album (ex Liu et al. 2023) TaxID=3031130 RepID=A0ABT5WYA0_9SPHN|nr:cysteine desulfurase family protein [Novosphingobium album (ex Liu et al. 2023)]MDE8654713.1 cysteine desulfurase family protein [Novosphingobium album (ex Liu et al. 2023)]
MNANPIYLDGFATLPLAPEARAAMLAVWDMPGNAGSPNLSGERAAGVIAEGRAAVAGLIGAAPGEIVFTSGATEANNLAVMGVAATLADLEPTRRRVVISTIEHKAVIEPAQRLKERGFIIERAPVDRDGRLDLEAFRQLMDDSVLVASVMLVNNETGVIQPIQEAAEIAHACGALFHCDAAQGGGKVAIDVLELDVDYLSLSAHKCYGPMGIGALYISAAAPKPEPLFFGGGQQAGVRPGTEPAALIAGFGAAATVARARLTDDQDHGSALLSRLLRGLRDRQIRLVPVSREALTVPGGAAISLAGIDADAVCSIVAGSVSLSTGSACTAGQIKSSHVLEAIGLSDLEARSVIRIFCNRYTTAVEIDAAIDAIADGIERSHLATGEVHQ